MKDTSHRNLLIALGVMVAAIILITVFFFSEGSLSFDPRSKNAGPVTKKPSAMVTTKKISQKIIPLFQSLKKSISF